MPFLPPDRSKPEIRASALAARDALSPERRAAAAEAVAARGLPFAVAPDTVVAGYAPIRSEFDPMPLLRRLADAGARLALPVIMGREQPLQFRGFSIGQALERDTAAVVTANGGKVVGGVKHPLNNADFSSFLLQAQASKAKIIGLANAGGDTTNSIKQAAEFGIIQGGQKLAPLLMFITDVHSLGLKTAQGLTFTESFYWDMNDQTRAWSKRFAALASKNAMPSMTQAGNYAMVLHYLKAMEALGGNPHDGAKVVAKMKELPTDDPLFGKGPLRADGRRLIPAYLFEVKKPEESKGPWDYYKLVATIAPEDAAKPLEASECPLGKKEPWRS